MNRNNQITLKDAIEKLIDTYKLRGGLSTVSLEKNWEELVGPLIAKYTTDIKMKNEVLIVKVSSAPLKNELMMMRSQIKKKLNERITGFVIKEILIL